MRSKIVVGSRGSRLAMLQTESVIARIKEANPSLEVGLSKIVTSGDKDRHTGLDAIGVDVFVKELEQALLARAIDLAVHSLKDVPTQLPKGLGLLAVLEREDPRDAVVAKSGLSKLARGAKVGTGSLRRSVQLTRFRSDLQVSPIRGNVDTRLRKVESGELDGVIVAAAAMARLGWQDKVTEYLPVKHFLPAAGQGALVIEGRLDDKGAAEIVAPLNHLPSWQAVTAERAFLYTLGGGCRAPIAALATVEGNTVKLEGMVAGSGGRVLRGYDEGKVPEEVGKRLAEKLLSRGATEFIAEVRGK